MAKQLFIDPKEIRKSGKIKFKDIPVNVYNKTVKIVFCIKLHFDTLFY